MYEFLNPRRRSTDEPYVDEHPELTALLGPIIRIASINLATRTIRRFRQIELKEKLLKKHGEKLKAKKIELANSE